MTLVVEDGLGRVDSQTYATVAELRAYAELRGATVPGPDLDCERLLIKAMDYLALQNFVGEQKSREQALPWPRYGAVVESWPLTNDTIPRQLIQAQCALAIEAQTIELLPTQNVGNKGPVTAETVGPISRTYANPGKVLKVPAVAKADALLRTLLKRNGLFAIRV